MLRFFRPKWEFIKQKHKIFFLRRHDFVSPPQNTPKVLRARFKIEKGIRYSAVCCVEDAQGKKNGANFIPTNYIENLVFDKLHRYQILDVKFSAAFEGKSRRLNVESG